MEKWISVSNEDVILTQRRGERRGAQMAAECIANDFVLVTNNTRHFQRMAELNTANRNQDASIAREDKQDIGAGIFTKNR